MMFIGAYWGPRRESRERVAERIAEFLQSLPNASGSLATWYTKGQSRASAKALIVATPDKIASRLKTNRREDNDEIMSELGFSIGAWNGGHASLHATIGAFTPYIGNSVVLSYDESSLDLSRSECRDVLESAVRAFDPDKAVATSSEYVTRMGCGQPWEAGMLTYTRGGKIEEHSIT